MADLRPLSKPIPGVSYAAYCVHCRDKITAQDGDVENDEVIWRHGNGTAWCVSRQPKPHLTRAVPDASTFEWIDLPSRRGRHRRC